ncbi:MAG: DUF5996 family protein [Pseudomonadota bacterium]
MSKSEWPELDWAKWRETAEHLQLVTQIVGKVRLALTPWLNHSWHVALYVTPNGLTTSPMPAGPGRTLQIDFNMSTSRLIVATSDGEHRMIPVGARTIADLYTTVIKTLAELNIAAEVSGTPSEIPDAKPFAEDKAKRPWDAEAVRRFHRALVSVDLVFKQFRTGFLGKASPVHFFWGSMDLAATRFSGRVAPKHPGGMPGLPDDVTCEAYSHEEASIGFWAGSDAYPQAAFYAYAYPSPEGYAGAKLAPEEAAWNAEMGEFLLPYDAVRTSADPEAALLTFCQSSYDAAADLAKWDREHLECPLGRPRVPRVV